MILPLYLRQALAPFLDEYSRVLVSEDQRNFKRGADLKLLQGERIVLASPDGSQFYLVVSDAGVLALRPVVAGGTTILVTTSQVTLTYGRAATRPRLVIA